MDLKIYRILVIMLLSLNSATVTPQVFTGTWSGKLQNMTMELPLVFNIQKESKGIVGTMDSPSESVTGIPLSSVEITGSKIELTVTRLNINYQGILNDEGKIQGVFTQQGTKMPLVLFRGKQISKSERTQELKIPYPYITEEVVIKNKRDKVSLSGTLSVPDSHGMFPVVILLTGSGPQNRDHEIMGHKPFLVISDHLVRNGIAVLRYDDRGFGKSSGDFSQANSYDFAQDAVAVIDFLKDREDIDPNKIGILGHSEGGLVGPIAANLSDDISYMILMAAPSETGDEILLDQIRLQSKLSGLNQEELESELKASRLIFDIIKYTEDEDEMMTKLRSLLKENVESNDSYKKPGHMTVEEYVELQSKTLATNWMKFFLNHDPIKELRQIEFPVLAINGAKDVQVSDRHLNTIQQVISESGNPNVTIKSLENLNHLFQECNTGARSEYATITQTIAPQVLDVITTWIIQTAYE